MKDENSMTFKYINMKTEDITGAPVYSDAFAEGGDPFNPREEEFGISLVDRMSAIMDEEATEKNDGIPVHRKD